MSMLLLNLAIFGVLAYFALPKYKLETYTEDVETEGVDAILTLKRRMVFVSTSPVSYEKQGEKWYKVPEGYPIGLQGPEADRIRKFVNKARVQAGKAIIPDA